MPGSFRAPLPPAPLALHSHFAAHCLHGTDLHDPTWLRIREAEISESQVNTSGPVSHLCRHGRIQPCRPKMDRPANDPRPRLLAASPRRQRSLSDKKRTASRETDVTWRRAPGTGVTACIAPRAWARGSPWPTSKRELGPARCETVQEEGGRLLQQPFPRLFLPRAPKEQTSSFHAPAAFSGAAGGGGGETSSPRGRSCCPAWHSTPCAAPNPGTQSSRAPASPEGAQPTRAKTPQPGPS